MVDAPGPGADPRTFDGTICHGRSTPGPDDLRAVVAAFPRTRPDFKVDGRIRGRLQRPLTGGNAERTRGGNCQDRRRVNRARSPAWGIRRGERSYSSNRRSRIVDRFAPTIYRSDRRNPSSWQRTGAPAHAGPRTAVGAAPCRFDRFGTIRFIRHQPGGARAVSEFRRANTRGRDKPADEPPRLGAAIARGG